MGAKSQTVLHIGMSTLAIDVECQITNGLPAMLVVGSASRRIDESRERVRNAILQSGFRWPRKRIAINLAPGDIAKDGTSLDLAIAMAILAADNQLAATSLENHVFIGELSLDGTLRPVRGLIGMLLGSRNLAATFVIPSANLSQARAIHGLTVVGVGNLQDVFNLFSGNSLLKPEVTGGITYAENNSQTTDSPSFEDVYGQIAAKRALEIAAAGGHNVLLTGPPGTGKSMLAKAFGSILPPASTEEILEITHLHSLVSTNYESVVTARPFRAPHHSASHTSITGGGAQPRPGEISLSHHGVLFLDELPEFSRQTIESLRQPLEDRHITVARARENMTFPADLILIATANPCPCGYLGSQQPCSCSPAQIQAYERKLSGPILDRIDLHVAVDAIDHRALLSNAAISETSLQIQKRVIKARARQQKRFAHASSMLNAHMNNKQLKQLCPLAPVAKKLLDDAAPRLQLSARAYMRTIKVAQTIADLETAPHIEPQHIKEALQYRRKRAEV